MSAEDSSVKGSSQQSSTSFPKVKGGGSLFSGLGPLITGGLVNDTAPETVIVQYCKNCVISVSKRLLAALALIVVRSIRATSAGLSCPLLLNVHAQA